jgi:hypothetical protein
MGFHKADQDKLWDILSELAGGNSSLIFDAFRHSGAWRPWGRLPPTIQDILFYIVDHREAAFLQQERTR